jgi:hypothetical protein
MPAVATCPGCRQSYTIPDGADAQACSCPSCHRPLQAPAPSPPVQVVPEPKVPKPVLDRRQVALGFWIAAIVWIIVSMIAAACGSNRDAPAWAAANILFALGVAFAVERLCRL